MSIFFPILSAFLFAFAWMFGAWVVYLFLKNPAIVDLAWTLCVGGISFLYFFSAESKSLVSFIVIGFMTLWTIRLGSLLTYRLCIYRVDRRYVELTAKWKKNLSVRYCLFFMIQGLGAVILTFPIVFIMVIDSFFIWVDALALLLVSIGFIGLVFADLQLQIFICKPENREKVCNIGLWCYSRHPNYFFEWIFWVGLFIFAFHLPWGFLSIISPVGLLYILLFVTGIPPAEEQSLRSKKQAYKDYQKTTSSFVPWWPKI